MKRKIILAVSIVLILTLSLLTFVACFDNQDDKKDDTVKVVSVVLDKESAEMTVGDTLQLTETVIPENATDKSVNWHSSNSAVATVTDGLVTAVAPGSATIVASSADGEKTANCVVTVSPAQGGSDSPNDNYVLPTNLKVVFNENEGYVVTVIKVGQDFYVSYFDPEDNSYEEEFYTYMNDETWVVCDRTFYEGEEEEWKYWKKYAPSDITQDVFKEEFIVTVEMVEQYLQQYYQNNMAFNNREVEFYYTQEDGSEITIYIDAQSGIVLKYFVKDEDQVEYDMEVTMFDESVTDFGDLDLPSDDLINNDPNADFGKVMAYDGSEITITFYHNMGVNLRAVLDEYIAKFNELYPNITINHRQVGSFDDLHSQTKIEIERGNQPNLVYCYPDHVADYNLDDAVMPLDEYISNSEFGLSSAQINDFIDGFYQQGKEYGDGKTYSLPFSKATEVMYYNKALFDQYGLSVPTTWEEMELVCKAIKEIAPSAIPLGYDSESNLFINMCYQLDSAYTSVDAPHYLFNNATNKGFVQMLKDWFDKGYIITQDTYGGYTSDLFLGGTCWMSIGSSAMANHYRPGSSSGVEVGVAPIPQANAEDPKVVSLGPDLCILKADGQEMAATWLFVKYLLTSAEFQADFSLTSGYMPVIESAVEHPVYQDFLAQANGTTNLLASAIKVAFQQKDAYFALPAFSSSNTERTAVGNIFVYVFNGEKTVDQAFEDAYNGCVY